MTRVGVTSVAAISGDNDQRVRPDRTVCSAHMQPTPFAPPLLDYVIRALEFVNDSDYPARGEA